MFSNEIHDQFDEAVIALIKPIQAHVLPILPRKLQMFLKKLWKYSKQNWPVGHYFSGSEIKGCTMGRLGSF